MKPNYLSVRLQPQWYYVWATVGDRNDHAILTKIFGLHLVREHFASPLLQLAEKDAEQTFVLVECPGTHLRDLYVV